MESFILEVLDTLSQIAILYTVEGLVLSIYV